MCFHVNGCFVGLTATGLNKRYISNGGKYFIILQQNKIRRTSHLYTIINFKIGASPFSSFSCVAENSVIY